MKITRIAIILLLGMLLVSGFACYGDEDREPTPSPTPTVTATPTEEAPSLELRVHFIDVGQGDSILINLGETEVLIDGGDRSPGVTTYLENYVDGNLEVLIATHPHADHIGGLIEVLDAFDVEEIWLNGDTHTSNTYSDFMDKVNAEGAEVKEARRGDTIVVDSLMFDVLHPVEPLVDDINNNSIVLMLSYSDIDFVFAGDAETEAEASMIADGVLTDIDILKVGHHGSRYSSSQALLDIIQPEVAIYMAGAGNQYGHPHEETLATLEDTGADVYGTDVSGTIIVMTDGNEYTIQVERACAPTPTPTTTPTTTPTPTPTPTPSPTPTPTPTPAPSPTPTPSLTPTPTPTPTPTESPVPTREVSGLISTDTVWTSDYIYIVTGNIGIEEGVTLTIEPGTVIEFDPGCKLQVGGALIAEGTSENNILFTSTGPPPTGLWDGIVFLEDSSPASVVAYSVIEYARYVEIQYVSPTIHHNIIRFAWDCGISLLNTESEVILSHNHISNCSLGICTRAKAAVTISQNTIVDNGKGVWICAVPYAGEVSIVNNNIHSSHQYNVYVLGGQSHAGYDVDATNNWWGTTDEALIEQHIYDYNDDLNALRVIYKPYATTPILGAGP